MNKKYNYQDVVAELEAEYGFKELGAGGFGVVLGSKDCAIKVIKDLRRCPELKREKQIYEVIEANRPLPGLAQVPVFGIFDELEQFCTFSLQRIYSPLSGWGDIDDDENGYGYVLSTEGKDYLFSELGGEIYKMAKNEVYGIEREGTLIHFYINHFDKDLKEKLDQGQGILMGENVLEEYFTESQLHLYCFEIGKLLSFLMIACHIVPTDIEVVLGSKSQKDRVVTPFIFDFNESSLYDPNMDMDTIVNILGRSLYLKNGRHYFPNYKNKYYESFYDGFVNHSIDPKMALAILNVYNSY